MSMISAQIDELRTAAQTYRRLGNHSAESMLLDAADTIWQLRDDLQRANAAVRDAEHDESMAWDRVRKAEGDNAKLRELCAGMLYDAMENICSKAYWCDEKSWQTCNDEKCGNRLYVEMARELGVVE